MTSFQRSIRVPLEGAELEAYEAQQKREREAALERQRLEEEQKRLKRERLELYDDDMDLEENTFSLATAWRGYDLYADRVRLDYEVAVKKSGKALPPPPHLMFPSIERRAVFDRYGEVLRCFYLFDVNSLSLIPIEYSRRRSKANC